MCVKHLQTFRPPNNKLPIQAYQQTMYVPENVNKLNTKLIDNLNQIKSHPRQKLNGKD